jgi:hydrogenase maturation factor
MTDACELDPHTGRCVTCGDTGDVAEVVAAADTGLVLARLPDGVREVAVDLIDGDVRPGDRLLVHAGVALLRLERVI